MAVDRLCLDTVDQLRAIGKRDGDLAVIQAAEQTLITVSAILGRVAGSDHLAAMLDEIADLWNIP
jgi:hypothetical protein